MAKVQDAGPPIERGQGLVAVARERMRTRHLSLRTEQAYLQWLRRHVVFHQRCTRRSCSVLRTHVMAKGAHGVAVLSLAAAAEARRSATLPSRTKPRRHEAHAPASVRARELGVELLAHDREESREAEVKRPV
jgi:hypothetical protein